MSEANGDGPPRDQVMDELARKLWSAAIVTWEYDGEPRYVQRCLERLELFSPAIQGQARIFRAALAAGAQNLDDACDWVRERHGAAEEKALKESERDGRFFSIIRFDDLLGTLEARYLASRMQGLSEEIEALTRRSNLQAVRKLLEREISPILGREPVDGLKLLRISDLVHRPGVSWLIEGLLPVQGLAAIYGPPSSGKTFLALDMALSLASRRPWCYRLVKPGPVVYVAAEGATGLTARVLAWSAANTADPGILDDSFFAVTRPVGFFNGEGPSLTAAIERAKVKPVLVVVDTLSRSFAGGDENSTLDMARFIGELDAIRIRLETTVLVIHHSSKIMRSLRGNSALEGALDSVIVCEADDGPDGETRVKVELEKQKDGPLGYRATFEIQTIDGNPEWAYLREVPADRAWAEKHGSASGLLQALIDQYVGQPIPITRWEQAYPEIGRRFGAEVKKLIQDGLVEQRSSGARVAYAPTERALNG